jgi:heat shock protein HslJ
MRSAKCAMVVAAATSVLACVLVLSGCAGIRGAADGPPPGLTHSSPTTSAAPGQSISGHWILISGQDGSQTMDPPAGTVTLNISGTRSGGNGGCNAFGATSSGTTTGPFTIRVGIHTDMACVGDERNVTEAQYFSALGKITSAALSREVLTLRGPGVTLTFDRLGS